MATRKIEQRVEIDTGDSVRELDAVERAALDADRAVGQVDESEITVDTDAAMKRLGEIEAELKALKDEKVSISAELDAAGFDTGDVRRRLDDLPDKKTVTVDVDTTGANNSLEGTGQKVRDIGSVVDEQTAGIAGDFLEAFEGVEEIAGELSPKVQKAFEWVTNIGVGAVATYGVLWTLGKVDEWLGKLTGSAAQTEEAIKKITLAKDLQEAGEAIKDLGPLFGQGGLGGWLRDLDRAFTGTYSSAEGRQRVFNELLEKAPGVAQKFYDTLINNRDVVILDPGEIVKMDELKGKVIATRDEVDGYKQKLDDARDAEIKARLASEEWSASVQAEYDKAKGAVDGVTGSVNALGATIAATPVFSGPIAPGYLPSQSRLDVNVNLNNGVVADPVALGRTISNALEQYIRATGGRGLART